GGQLVPPYRCAGLPELDGAERHGRGGSHGRVGRVAVDAAGRGQERGRAEHEHTFEHGACLGEMVALAQSVSHLSCVSIWTAYHAPQGRTSIQRKRNVGVAFKGTRWYDMQH